jgi:hypothetical protein
MTSGENDLRAQQHQRTPISDSRKETAAPEAAEPETIVLVMALVLLPLVQLFLF